MKTSIKSLLTVMTLSFLGLAYQNCAPAHDNVSGTPTALGEQVSADQIKSIAKKKASSSGAEYSVQQVQMGGSTVKEYIDSNGVVFAMTWQGLTFPDLSQLLGSYYGNYQQERARVGHNPGVRAEHTETSQLVVRRSGHMRDLHGQAYDARLFPQGFSVEDLQ